MQAGPAISVLANCGSRVQPASSAPGTDGLHCDLTAAQSGHTTAAPPRDVLSLRPLPAAAIRSGVA